MITFDIKDLYVNIPIDETISPSTAVAALLEGTWAVLVVPSGMPHRVLHMFLRDMKLVVASDEAPGTMGSDPSSVNLCGLLGC
jgi:hypothetical protein